MLRKTPVEDLKIRLPADRRNCDGLVTEVRNASNREFRVGALKNLYR
jgi:hypothetical protein